MNYIGQSGLGKSTLVNTIFASHLIDSKGRLNADEPPRQTTEIENVSHCKFSYFIFLFIFKSNPEIIITFYIYLYSLFSSPKVIEEHGVRLRLNIVDTPGYGDQVNNENWYEMILLSS